MCRYAFYGCVSLAWMVVLHAYYCSILLSIVSTQWSVAVATIVLTQWSGTVVIIVC